ncbi:hypothetical protein Pfo_018755 [Paulownia fortunei]|nr:hypothetical protein Pfo_018755 [Paulownia fortunei]
MGFGSARPSNPPDILLLMYYVNFCLFFHIKSLFLFPLAVTARSLVTNTPPTSDFNRVDRIMSMQQQMGEMEEELRRTKEKFSVSEVEKYRVLDQLREAKEAAQEANMRANEAFSPKKAAELIMELENLKKLLAGSRDELKMKDKKIDSLELELGKARQLELALAEKDASVDKLNKELRDVREMEKDTTVLLSDNKKRILELEAELERKKKSESSMADSLAVQTRQLEATKFELEELKIEMTSLHEKIESMEELSKQKSREVKGSSSVDNGNSKSGSGQEGEKKASLRATSILEEMELLKNEWKLAIEAEEKSTKAMEDLALALKEVATEANQAKEKLSITQIELEHVKGEAEQLKEMVRSTEERYQNLLYEAKQEAELHKNTADRLRVEAEETLLALNGKEMGFVSCIRKAEEERAIAQHESNKLVESLEAAEHMTRAAREETYKLRDILKQAVNEANAAKAAAGIARDENSLLKDCLAEKEEALHFLTRENERLRISEAAAHENVKQLKRLLSTASTEFKTEDKEQNGMLRFQDSVDDEEHENKNMNKTFSFNLEDLKFMNEPEDAHEKVLDEDPEKAEALKGSIFDANAETPKSEPHTPKSAYSKQRGNSSVFTEDRGTPKSEDFDHLDSAHDDSDTDKNSHRRMKTMLQRVGDLLTIRRSFHRKEPSIE